MTGGPHPLLTSQTLTGQLGPPGPIGQSLGALSSFAILIQINNKTRILFKSLKNRRN